MRVIILAKNKAEALDYMALANLRGRDVTIVSSPQSLNGLRLDETDLIAEFPGFNQHRDADKIRATLRRVMAKNEAQPLWKIIGKS